MNREVSLKKWVEVVGKEKLQTFHDCFAARNGIALQLFDAEGQRLIVPSKGCLLCHEVKNHANSQCKVERVEAHKKVAESGKLEVFTCSMGLTVFICPLFSNNRLIGFGNGGYVVCEGSPISKEICEKFKIPKMSQKELLEIGKGYASIASLLNVDYTKLYMATEGDNTSTDYKINDPRLTTREKEVAELICKGLSNKEIAEQLYISEKTVKSHISNIFLKLEINDRAQVIIYYSKTKTK